MHAYWITAFWNLIAQIWFFNANSLLPQCFVREYISWSQSQPDHKILVRKLWDHWWNLYHSRGALEVFLHLKILYFPSGEPLRNILRSGGERNKNDQKNEENIIKTTIITVAITKIVVNKTVYLRDFSSFIRYSKNTSLYWGWRKSKWDYSRIILIYYCKCCNLIGYSTRYLFLDR